MLENVHCFAALKLSPAGKISRCGKSLSGNSGRTGHIGWVSLLGAAGVVALAFYGYRQDLWQSRSVSATSNDQLGQLSTVRRADIKSILLGADRNAIRPKHLKRGEYIK